MAKDKKRDLEVIEPGDVGSVEALMPDLVPSKPAKEEAPQEEPSAPVSLERELTVDAWARPRIKDPIVKAFVTGERRANKIRKQTPSAWREAFEQFVSTER